MFDDSITKYAVSFNVPLSWIKAVIETESNWNPNAYRAEPQINDASYGLMQLLYRTAQGLGYTGDPEGLFDPDTNIQLGAKLLAQLRDRYGEDFRRVYSAYNSGRPDLWETSSEVGAHVARAVAILEKWIAQDPVIATAGGLAALIAFAFVWYWTRRKRGR